MIVCANAEPVLAVIVRQNSRAETMRVRVKRDRVGQQGSKFVELGMASLLEESRVRVVIVKKADYLLEFRWG